MVQLTIEERDQIADPDDWMANCVHEAVGVTDGEFDEKRQEGG
jgi:hypothetical protein